MTTLRSRAASLWFVTLVVLLDSIGIGMFLPIAPRLVEEVTGLAAAPAAVRGGWLTAMYALANVVCAPLLGRLSDRYGRRPVLLASLAAFAVAYLLGASAASFSLLMVAQTLAGCFGATITAANAYVTDVTTSSERTVYLSRLSAAFGVGLLLGPLVGGLLGAQNIRLPLYSAAALSMLNLGYGLVVLKESRASAGGSSSSQRLGRSALLQVRLIPKLLALHFASRVAATALPAIWPYFTAHTFRWSPAMIGYSFAAYGIAIVLLQLLFARCRLATFPDHYLVSTSLALTALSYLGFTIVDGPVATLLLLIPSAAGFVLAPALVSLMTKRVGTEQQGYLQGVLSSSNSVATIVSGLLMTMLFSYFTSASQLSFPTAPFALCAWIAVAALAWTVIVLRNESFDTSGS